MDQPTVTYSNGRLSLSYANGNYQRDVWLWKGYLIPKASIYLAISAVLAGFILILIVALVHHGTGEHLDDGMTTCQKDGCVQQAAYILESMNVSADPCSDFYEFACGRFPTVHPRGSDVSVRVADLLYQRTDARIQDLLEQQVHTDTAIDQARLFYGSCVGTFDRWLNYSSEMAALVNELGGLAVPVLLNADSWDLNWVLSAVVSNYSVPAFFQLMPVEWGGHRMLVLFSPLLYLDWFSVSDRQRNSTMFEYRGIITSVLWQLGKAQKDGKSILFQQPCDVSCVHRISEDIVEFEAQLADLHRSHNGLFSTELIDRTQLHFWSPNINFTLLVENSFGPKVMAEASGIKVPKYDFFSELNSLVHFRTHDSVIQNYLMWQLIRSFLPALGPVFRPLLQDLIGERSDSSNDQFCVDLTLSSVYEAIGTLFLNSDNNHAHLLRLPQLFMSIERFLADRYDPSSSRWALLRKVFQIRLEPTDAVFDIIEMSNLYRNLSVDDINLFYNRKAAIVFIKEAIQSGRLLALNAQFAINWFFLKGNSNQLGVFQAGYDSGPVLQVMHGTLQVPWFHSDNPSYVNIAGLGAMVLARVARFVLFHDLRSLSLYSVDEQTERYAACVLRLLVDISDASATVSGISGDHVERFIKRLKHNYVQFPLLHEHFALQTSYRLMHSMSPSQTVRLPALENYSRDQLFYIAYVQARCENRSPQHRHTLLDLETEDRLSPEIMNAFLLDQPEFIAAFHCPSTIISPGHNDMCKI